MPEPPTPDPPPEPAYRAYYGTGYAGADFRGIGGDLLKTFPPLAPPVPTPPAIDPTAAGFGVHGPHLLAPLIDGMGDSGDSRVSPCPVCRTTAVVSRTAGGWVPLRCESCGMEFVASDGTAPSPPPAPPKARPKASPLPPPPAPADSLARKLELWVASGEPLDPADVRRVLDEATERYRAELGRAAPELTPVSVFTSSIFVREDGRRVARCPVCAAEVAVPTTAAERVPAWCPFCGTEYVAVDTPAPRPSPKPTPAPAPPAPVLPRSKVHPLPLGGRYARCPVCRASELPILRSATGEVRLKCPTCGAVFLADAPEPTPPRPLPSPPPDRRWFGDLFRALFAFTFPVLIVLALLVWSTIRNIFRG
jgi:transposase-like protein